MLIHFNLKGSAEHNAVLLGRLRSHAAIVSVEVEKLGPNTAQFRVESMPGKTTSGFTEVIAQELAEHHNRLIDSMVRVQEGMRDMSSLRLHG